MMRQKNLPASLGNWLVSVGSQLITLNGLKSLQLPSRVPVLAFLHTSPEAHPNLGEKAKG